MVSILALVSAILLAVAVEAESLLWLGLTLFTAGLLPLAFAFMRPATEGAAGNLDRLTAPGRSAVALHLGSLLAQTGLIVALIAPAF
jgi:hypothetical protein